LSWFLIVLVVAASFAIPAFGAWPEKPVKIIVPFKPGGTTDQTVRMFQKAIVDNDLLPHKLTVINIGGHYSVGCRKALESEPDGYTFLVIHKALMGAQATGLIDFKYSDFEAVAETSKFNLISVVREDSKWKTLDELLKDAKANPDSIIFGCNLGALNHMAGVTLLNTEPGASFRFVQIGGGTANFTALVGKQTKTTVLSAAEFINFRVKGLRGLGYMANERHPMISDVPTTIELGRKAIFGVGSWWFAPKGTPKEAVAGLANVLEKAMKTRYVKEQLEKKAFAPSFLKGAAFEKELDEEWERTRPVALQTKKK
jgi:tripartite-type tricarboxylate transporter receptor subunit TctC